MPRILRGEALANAIYQATDKLEEQFAEIFIAEVRKLSRSKALQELLDEIEAGQIASAGVTSRLSVISIPTKKLDEIIRKAMGSAIRITNEKTGLKLSFDYRNPDVIQAARGMSIDLSTNLSKTAQQILEKTIGDAIEGIITRREAINIIASRVGLIPAHAEAVERYYERLIADGKKKVDAKRLAEKYADRLLRYRATTIARTEIARATGIGQTEFWKQAIADGLLPPKTKRVWITAADELVCEICGPMDGVQVEIGQPWMTQNGLVQYPSGAHPNCRCTQGIALSKDYLKMFRTGLSERQEIIEELQKEDILKLDWWLLSKANPYHDELGRFTSADKATGGKGGKPKVKRGSGENRTVKEQLADGPLNLAFGRDASGMPVVGTAEQIKERYGSTPEQWTAYFKNKYGIEVDFKDTNAFDDEVRTAATLGAVQALDDVLSNLNVLPSGLTTNPPLATIKINNGVKPKGWYMGALNGFVQTHSPAQQDGLPRDSRAFILGVNTQVCADSTRSVLEGVQDDIARQEGNMPFSDAEQLAVQQAQSSNVSGRAAVVGVSDFYNPDMKAAAARLAYAVVVHEFGHILDIPELFLPQNKMPAGTSRDLKNTSDSIRRTPWSRIKSVSEYGSFFAHEKMAEGFAAWFLFSQLTGSSKILTSYTTMGSPNAKQTYGDIKQLSAKIISPLLENLNPPITSQQIVKQDGSSVTIVSELPPDHPIIVFTLAPFLKNVSKANPYHDELGRFTSADKATGGKGRRPKVKRKKEVVEETPSSKGKKIIESFRKSGVPEYVIEGIIAEARQHDSAMAFKFAFNTKFMRGVYAHITDNKNFKVGLETETIIRGAKKVGINITADPSGWRRFFIDEIYQGLVSPSLSPKERMKRARELASRDYIAIITMPTAPKGSYVHDTAMYEPNAVFVQREGLPHIKVHAVLPYSSGLRKLNKIQDAVIDTLRVGGDHLIGGRVESIWAYAKEGIEKANPYHDELGRFTSADKATGGKGRKPKMKRGGSKLISGMKKVFKTAQDHGYILNGRQQTALSRLAGGKAVTTPPKELRDFFAYTNGELTVVLRDVRVYSSWTDPNNPHGSIGCDMDILDKNGIEVGKVEYSVSIGEDGKLGQAEHSLMHLAPHAQGTGFGFEYVSRITSQLEAAGVPSISIQAGLDIGGYAWAKQGYQWSSTKSRSEIIEATNTTFDLMTGFGTDKDPASRIEIQASAELVLSEFVSEIASKKWVRDGTKKMQDDVSSSIDKAVKQISQPKFQEVLKQARKILEQGDTASGKPSPKDIANLGREASFTILVPVENAKGKVQLKPITLWAGKLALLGQGWSGILPLGGRDIKLDSDGEFYEAVEK